MDINTLDSQTLTAKDILNQLQVIAKSEETFNDYPDAAVNNAKKALRWRKEHGRDVVKGGTPVGWQRANQLANREKLSKSTIRRMAAFNRHRKNSKVDPKFKDEPWRDRGYVAWLIWGGTSGVNWAIRKSESFKNQKALTEKQKMDCMDATQDVKLNTKNRDATIKLHMYGPLNVDEPADYWEKIADKWETSVEAAKKSLCANCVAFDISPRMKNCMPGETSDDDGELGYCWMHHFKCHSARTCNTWAKGGPIKKDEDSYMWQEKNVEGDEKAEKASGGGIFDTSEAHGLSYMAVLNRAIQRFGTHRNLVRYLNNLQKPKNSIFYGLTIPKSKENKDRAKRFMKREGYKYKKSVEDESQKKGDNPCWDGYEQRGMKKGKDGKLVPNCVPIKKAADDPQTPAPKKDRIRGSDKNPSGSASGQRGGIKLSKDVLKSIENKVKEHNEKVKKEGLAEWRKLNVGQAKAVVRRGLGAYSSSHRPSVTSRTQWGIARLNAFIHLLLKDKPKNPKYVTDNDLLPKKHPRYSSEKKDLDVFDTVVKIFQEEDLRNLDVYQKTIDIFGVEQQDAVMVSKFNTLTNSKAINSNETIRPLEVVLKEMKLISNDNPDLIYFDDIMSKVNTLDDELIEKQLNVGEIKDRARLIQSAIKEFGTNAALKDYLENLKSPEKSQYYNVRIPKGQERRGQAKRDKIKQAQEKIRQLPIGERARRRAILGGQSKPISLSLLKERLGEKWTQIDPNKIKDRRTRNMLKQAQAYEKRRKEIRAGRDKDKEKEDRERLADVRARRSREEDTQAESKPNKLNFLERKRRRDRLRELKKEEKEALAPVASKRKERAELRVLFSKIRKDDRTARFSEAILDEERAEKYLQRDFEDMMASNPSLMNKLSSWKKRGKSAEDFQREEAETKLQENMDDLESIFKDAKTIDTNNRSQTTKAYKKRLEDGDLTNDMNTFIRNSIKFEKQYSAIERLNDDLIDKDEAKKNAAKKYLDGVRKIHEKDAFKENNLSLLPTRYIDGDVQKAITDPRKLRRYLRNVYFDEDDKFWIRQKEKVKIPFVSKTFEEEIAKEGNLDSLVAKYGNRFRMSVANHLSISEIDNVKSLNNDVAAAQEQFDKFNYGQRRRDAITYLKQLENITKDENFTDNEKRNAKVNRSKQFINSLRSGVEGNDKFYNSVIQGKDGIFGELGLHGNFKLKFKGNSIDKDLETVTNMANIVKNMKKSEFEEKFVKGGTKFIKRRNKAREDQNTAHAKKMTEKTNKVAEINAQIKETQSDTALTEQEKGRQLDRLRPQLMEAQRELTAVTNAEEEQKLVKKMNQSYKEGNKSYSQLEKQIKQTPEAYRPIVQKSFEEYKNNPFVRNIRAMMGANKNFDFDKISNQALREKIRKTVNENLDYYGKIEDSSKIKHSFIPSDSELAPMLKDMGLGGFVSKEAYRLKKDDETDEEYPFTYYGEIDKGSNLSQKSNALAAEIERMKKATTSNPVSLGTTVQLSNDEAKADDKMMHTLNQMKSIYSPEEPKKKSINDLLNDMKSLYED